MIVLGVDPGTRHLGWGVLRGEGNRYAHVAHGVIDMTGPQPLEERLVVLEAGLLEVIARFRPVVASVESLFFHKDPQAAAKLGHARGVVLLSLARSRVEVRDYAPALVKNSVTGHGRAGKGQMVRMVKTLLCLDADPREDAADALALALTYLRRAPIEQALARRAATVAR